MPEGKQPLVKKLMIEMSPWENAEFTQRANGAAARWLVADMDAGYFEDLTPEDLREEIESAYAEARQEMKDIMIERWLEDFRIEDAFNRQMTREDKKREVRRKREM